MYTNALITGASSGLGMGLAKALAAKGTHVVLAARRVDRLQSLVDEIKSAGGAAEALTLDCAQADATYEAVKALDQRLPLDLVIANAGRGGPTWAKKFRWEKVRDILQLNMMGACATLCGALPGMVERNRGHLVGMASLAGFRGMPGSSAYSASKSALITFLESIRVDLRDTDIAVTAICPGFVKTELTQDNKHPMPFAMELDDAVEVMMHGLERRVPLCAFPAPMALPARMLPLVPNSLYDWLSSRQRVGS